MGKELTPEELQAENARLTQENKETRAESSKLQQANTDLKAENANLKVVNGNLTADKQALVQANAELNGELSAAGTIIAGQAEQLANAETAQAEAAVVIVTHEQKQYRVLGKQFNVKGEVIKAEDLGKNKEALKHLVDTKSGLLHLVVKAGK